MTYKMQNKRTRRNSRKALFVSVFLHVAAIGGILYATGSLDDVRNWTKGAETEAVAPSKMKAPQDKALGNKKPKSKSKKP